MKQRSLKALAPLVLASFLLNSPAAFALTGGPFDVGRSPGATASGTYSGVITGKNLTGIVQFGISDSSESNGRFAIFHEGIMSYGVCEAIADAANQRIAGALLGVAALPGETTGSSANITGDTAFQAITARGSAEGAFTAEMKDFPVAITYEGEGELATVANPTTVTSTETVANAVVITAAGAADNGADNSTPQIFTTTADGTVQPTVLRATTPFEIRGSRTSLTVYTAINNFAALPPRAPATPTGGAATPAP